MTWTGCPYVETRPGVVSGAPVLKGTRLPVQAVLDNHADGLSPTEIAEQFDVAEEQVLEVIAYATQRAPHPV